MSHRGVGVHVVPASERQGLWLVAAVGSWCSRKLSICVLLSR
jgi:hypothetical protein